MVSGGFEFGQFKRRSLVRGRLEANSQDCKRAREEYLPGSREVTEASDDILFVYLVELDGIGTEDDASIDAGGFPPKR
jgi:hypothetical protein